MIWFTTWKKLTHEGAFRHFYILGHLQPLLIITVIFRMAVSTCMHIAYIFMYTYLCLSIYLSIYLSLPPLSICPSLPPSHPSIHPSIHLHYYLCVFFFAILVRNHYLSICLLATVYVQAISGWCHPVGSIGIIKYSNINWVNNREHTGDTISNGWKK